MDEKTLHTLEYFKILERLVNYCAFSASAEKARALRPTNDIVEARQRLAETTEAVNLLVTRSDLTIGGARDVRAAVDLANHGGVLPPVDLLDIKYTLVAARNLMRTFERLAEQYPHLADIAAQLISPPGLIDAITRAISDRSEILDSASVKLSTIRRELRIAHERLMTRLQRMVGDPALTPYLQEALITQRDGRFVLPLRAEFKGRIRSIVHDQSASGATLFVEPLAIVELNNKYRELQLAERDEERRILAELSLMVADHGFAILNTVDVIARLDCVLARARYAEESRATEPKLHPIPGKKHIAGSIPQQAIRDQASEDNHQPSAISGQQTKIQPPKSTLHHHPGTIIRLYQARHPLLDPQTVVPIDVELDEKTYAMVVTGPNTGGKTVALKTIGLLALMAQSGLHIPAHSGSELSVFDNIYADIGDEQSIEQSLSTFSGHVTNIIHILKESDRHSLVILDELGAGTDPQEGAALARAILKHLLERGITTLVTTHHPELKAFAHTTPGAVNACVEFDLQTLRPTFRLTIGLPGRSNALAIAQRLGIPGEIISEARTELSPEQIRADDLLNEIHLQRNRANRARDQAENARKEAESLRSELVERLEKIEDERRKVLEQARLQAEAQIQALQTEVAEVRKSLARARQPVEVLKPVEEQVAVMEENVEQPVARQALKAGAAAEQIGQELRRSIRLGDKVNLRTLGAQGLITALGEEEAEVQVGMLRVRARRADLELASGELSPQASGHSTTSPGSREISGTTGATTMRSSSTSAGDFLPSSPGMELDLRGQRAEDALEALERYLDSAFLAGLLFVRIIHGKGTGKLREAVRQALAHNPHVRSFESGHEKEGGEGVTVAKIKSS